MQDLVRTIGNLEIRTAEDEDGSVTIYSVSEPLFCFVRSSREQAIEAARSTVISYAKLFHGVDVRIELAHKSFRSVPVKRITPTGKISSRIEGDISVCA